MPRAPAALPRGSALRCLARYLLQRRHLDLQAFVLAFGFVGGEDVGAGSALAPAPLRGVGASMFLLQEVDGLERVREIVAEIARGAAPRCAQARCSCISAS